MRTILVTGSDTGVGKTRVVGALARLLATGSGRPARVQIVKVVETGRRGAADPEGDAATAARLAGAAEPAGGPGAGGTIEGRTLASYPEPIAPSAAAAAVGQTVSFESLVAAVHALPECDWRILEGAGGVATPIDAAARDWADFGRAVGVDATVVVVPDRLGAINQGRLAYARASQAGAPSGLWLNATAAVDPLVAASTRDGLRSAGLPLWAEQGWGEAAPRGLPSALLDILEIATGTGAGVATAFGGPASAAAEAANLASAGGPVAGDAGGNGDAREAGAGHGVLARCRSALAEREAAGLRRRLRVTPRDSLGLNLADNDYLDLAHDPALAAAVADAAATHGTSASASPLITGWGERHARLTERLCAWHGFAAGLLWTSGYAANSAVLGGLPGRGDLVLADRLIHASMIAGLRRSGARIQRYEHLRLDRLEELLAGTAGADRQVFVVTESVFSMDGDHPDVARMAELKRRYGFLWVVDEAHALGWYGPDGAGLVRQAGVAAAVDVLVGTFGKALASGGAYTLFQRAEVRDYLVNTAGEFVYSTALAPTNVAAAAAAVERARELAPEQPGWHEASRSFRRRLREAGWQVTDGDSPIVPVGLNDPSAAVALAEALRERGILVSAIRPPTVPVGTSRLRISLKRSFGPAEADRVLAAMAAWRAAR